MHEVTILNDALQLHFVIFGLALFTRTAATLVRIAKFDELVFYHMPVRHPPWAFGELFKPVHRFQGSFSSDPSEDLCTFLSI